MGKVFDRDVSPGHPLEAPLLKLDGVRTSERFIAHNWRHDWRVCEFREQRLLEHFAESPGHAELRPSYERYYDNCLCRGSPPDYLHQCNAPNLYVPISPRNWLGRLVCLNTFSAAAREALPEVAAMAPRDWATWLDAAVATRRELGPVALRQFVDALLQAWNKWPGRNLRPTFASFWADVEPLLDGPAWPDRLRDALGMGHIEAENWVIVLRYQVREVPGCVRPTSLEAGWTPWHFPSPRGEIAGRAMDLELLGAGLCCREVVHRPVPLQIQHWAGCLGRTSTSPTGIHLDELRRRHHQRLRERLGDELLHWMPSPV